MCVRLRKAVRLLSITSSSDVARIMPMRRASTLATCSFANIDADSVQTEFKEATCFCAPHDRSMTERARQREPAPCGRTRVKGPNRYWRVGVYGANEPVT